MRCLLAVSLSLGLATAVPKATAAEPDCGPGGPLTSSLRLDYTVIASRGLISLRGEGWVAYQRSGSAYSMESSLRAQRLFEAQQSSSGEIGPDGLIPTTFTQRTSHRPPLRVDFDWAGQRVYFSQTGNSAPTQPMMQDRLSVIIQLAWRQRTMPLAVPIELPVAGHRSESTYVFTLQGNETSTFDAGTFETIRFERRGRGGDDLLEVWLAPNLCSLPVRLRFTDEKGTVIDQQLRAVRLSTS
jgi:hypothetical protein